MVFLPSTFQRLHLSPADYAKNHTGKGTWKVQFSGSQTLWYRGELKRATRVITEFPPKMSGTVVLVLPIGNSSGHSSITHFLLRATVRADLKLFSILSVRHYQAINCSELI